MIAADPAPASDRPNRAVTLQFSDNALLPLLFGDHDRNLVRLEQGLHVRLTSRGNRVAITGEPERVQAAEQTLNALYKRLEAGKSVSRADVETAIRMAEVDGDPRLPLSDMPAILTKRGAVGARSPRQAAYMESAGAAGDGVRHRPGRHRQDVSGRGPGGRHAAGRARRSNRALPAPRSRPASASASCRATSRKRSIPISARSTTRCTT